MTTFPRPPAGDDESALLDASGFDPNERPSALPDSLFSRMRADPAHAAELLALAAVERFGPEAAQWVATYRSYYPHATDGQLIAIVRARFVWQSRYSGAVAGVGGAFGAVVDFGVLAWTQARMVLYIAAVYGLDPTSEERAAELLMLQHVHKALGTARTALEVASRKAPPSQLLKHGGGSLGALGLALARMAGMRAVKRAAMKVVPFASIAFGAMANARSTKALADRAIALYRR